MTSAMADLGAARPGSVAYVVGDRLRTVRAAPELSECDVLLVDTEDQKPQKAKARNLLLDDLPNVLQRATISANTLVLSGASCELSDPARHVGGLGRGWCTAWDEFISRRLVRPLRCSRAVGSSTASRWCAGAVEMGSLCSTRPPLLERAGWAADE
eukprot:6979560-Prymnesium_polylepis.1